MPLEEVRGFRVVPLPLGRPDGFARFLFMREHVDKSGVTQGRTLFVTNVGDDGAAALEAVFSTCGEIEAIELAGATRRGATSAAHVTFKSRAALQRALSLRRRRSRARSARPRGLAHGHVPRSCARTSQTDRRSRSSRGGRLVARSSRGAREEGARGRRQRHG